MKDLITKFLKLKKAEEAARNKRVVAEEAIAQAMGELKLEGTKTLETDGFRVAVTTKLTRTLDYDKYLTLNIPKEYQFVDLKPQINVAAFRIARLAVPQTDSCITTAPAKTSVKVEVMK